MNALQKNITRMLNDRGVEGNDSIETVDIQTIEIQWCMKRDDFFYIFYVTKIDKALITLILDYFKQFSAITNCILIYSDKCTPSALKEIAHMKTINIECFNHDEIEHLVVDNALTSSTRLLTNDEIMKKQINKNEIAIMNLDDPIHRYFNAPVNSVYEITEHLGTLPPITKYRVVREKIF